MSDVMLKTKDMIRCFWAVVHPSAISHVNDKVLLQGRADLPLLWSVTTK